MSREWGVPVPETEYPTLPGMTIGDLDEILCTETAPTLGEGGGAAVATGSGVVPGVAAEPESVRERQNPSARGSFEGKVAVAFTVGDRRIELVCLPAKARIEARDGSSGDLVMILGRKSEVSSPDLVVERSANGTWWIPAWGISIELAALSGRQCAEFLTDDDKTIVCLVIS
jgi:hypothetical protein